MELGWIDFSTTDRNKILSVLDLLGEKGVLDELGIASIRDAFSEYFFPGTSTVQTRAKYFLMTPYIFRDLELNKDVDYTKLKLKFYNTEENCAHIIMDKNPDEKGVIGKRAINNGKWVNRKPASIYWAGLRKYGIIRYKLSIDDCIKIIGSQKRKKRKNSALGNSTDKSEGSSDDKFAGDNQSSHFINCPTYSKDWINELDIKLTYDEGQFLKNQIISTCENSMLGYILKEDLYEVLSCDSFLNLDSIIHKFPQEIQKNYYKAVSFSEFVFALRVIYNILISDGKNENANEWFNKLNLKEYSQIDIDNIMDSFGIYNPKLKKFLNDSKNLMKNEDVDGLKKRIQDHEISLKGNRAKSQHIGEFDPQLWYGGEILNYRFHNAKNIIQDIYDSENKGDD